METHILYLFIVKQARISHTSSRSPEQTHQCEASSKGSDQKHLNKLFKSIPPKQDTMYILGKAETIQDDLGAKRIGSSGILASGLAIESTWE